MFLAGQASCWVSDWAIIDHHVLNLHHVRDIPVHVPLYDWLFLAIGGVGFILIGLGMSRRPVV